MALVLVELCDNVLELPHFRLKIHKKSILRKLIQLDFICQITFTQNEKNDFTLPVNFEELMHLFLNQKF